MCDLFLGEKEERERSNLSPDHSKGGLYHVMEESKDYKFEQRESEIDFYI